MMSCSFPFILKPILSNGILFFNKNESYIASKKKMKKDEENSVPELNYKGSETPDCFKGIKQLRFRRT